MPTNITKPTVGGSTGTWGSELNTALDQIVSGLNTLENSGGTGGIPASTVTARGDLIVATANGTVSRHGVGTNGHVLTADNTTGTGVAWKPPAGSLVFKARQSSAQNFADGEEKGVTFNVIEHNPLSAVLASSTTFTPGITGWYEFSGGVTFNANATGVRSCYWVTGGAPIAGSNATIGAISGLAASVTARTISVYLTVAAGVALYAYQNAGVSMNTSVNAQHASYMQVKYLGAS